MSVYVENAGNDRYKLVFTRGSDELRIRRSKTIKITGSKKEVERTLKKITIEFENQVEKELREEENYIYDNRSFESLATEWLKLKKADVTIKTYSWYESVVTDRFIPKFKKYKCKNMSMKLVKKYKDNLLTTNSKLDGSGPLSPNSVRKYLIILSQIFSDAVKYQLISENFIGETILPKKEVHLARFYNQEDINNMIIALDKESLQFKCFAFISSCTGCRRGELAALKWSDIDFNKNTITIDRAVTNVKLKGDKERKRIIKIPKSVGRIIEIPPSLTELLKELLLEEKKKKFALGPDWQGETNIEENYIFTNEHGFWYASDTYSRKWNKFIKKNNLKKINLHELRHTNASIMISSGMSIKEVQNLLGHTRPSTTLNIYTHLFNSSSANSSVMQNTFFKDMPLNLPLKEKSK